MKTDYHNIFKAPLNLTIYENFKNTNNESRNCWELQFERTNLMTLNKNTHGFLASRITTTRGICEEKHFTVKHSFRRYS